MTTTSRSRRAWIIVWISFTAIILLSPWAWRELTIRSRYTIGGDLSVLETRSSRVSGKCVGASAWDLETGMLLYRLSVRGDRGRVTNWSKGGAITSQAEFIVGQSGPGWTTPPWRFGATAQTEPTAPWIEEGAEFEEWFRALDAIGLIDPPGPLRPRLEN